MTVSKSKINANRQIASALHDFLCEQFPKCFFKKGESKKPLKIGIHRDIAKIFPEILPRHLNLVFNDYTNGPTYLRSIVTGSYRIDLDGNPVTIIEQHHEDYAAKKLRRMRLRTPIPAQEVGASA